MRPLLVRQKFCSTVHTLNAGLLVSEHVLLQMPQLVIRFPTLFANMQWPCVANMMTSKVTLVGEHIVTIRPITTVMLLVHLCSVDDHVLIVL